jgi:ornithine carbamoyltransferase
MNRFLDLADFEREEILDLLRLAQSLQDHPQPHALAGKILGLEPWHRCRRAWPASAAVRS